MGNGENKRSYWYALPPNLPRPKKSDLVNKVSIVCISKVSGPVWTTTVLATIDMPEYRDVNISDIEEFDSVLSDRIIDEIEGFKNIVKDLGNLDVKIREKPRVYGFKR